MYAFATFDGELKVDCDLTNQIGMVKKRFLKLPAPMTNDVRTYDAIYGMLDEVGRLPGRRVLFIVGSGVDTSSAQYSIDDVRKKIEAENVTVFAAGLSSVLGTRLGPYLESGGRLPLIQAEGFLSMLADKSGGTAWFPNKVKEFRGVMERAMQTIRMQYRIVYDRKMHDSGKPREIRIEAFRTDNCNRDVFEVRARNVLALSNDP
jgi:hypothetical protein